MMIDCPTNNKTLDAYDALWEKYGSGAQVDKVIEEMSELTKALLKARQKGEIFTEEVDEEIADVIVMMEQLLINARRHSVKINDCDCRSAWDKIVAYREVKLEKIIRIVGFK